MLGLLAWLDQAVRKALMLLVPLVYCCALCILAFLLALAGALLLALLLA